MSVHTDIHYARLEGLSLDPTNPRLGRTDSGAEASQDSVIKLMMDWNLEELAVSFVESGFWPQEALLVVQEKLYGRPGLVVVEGNRRLAALKLLRDTVNGSPPSSKWAGLFKAKKVSDQLFEKIPYIVADSRDDIGAFLGFRHVTGIMQWRPTEKAQYIARLVEGGGLSYEEVMRKIGSKTPTVRQNYISYRLLLQIQDAAEGVPKENLEERFSVMYLSLRTQGVQRFLQIDVQADPERARLPVPKNHLNNLKSFALWLFGDDKRGPLFTDSRQVDNFGRILESKSAVQYLQRNESPKLEVALRMAGGDLPELIRLIEQAADNIELALTRVHLYAKDAKLQSAVKRLSLDASQLLRIFPRLEKVIKETQQMVS